MGLADVAVVLIDDYHVWNALNLDGGGSTTMAWEDPATGAATVVNASSDNPDGRSVATSLAVFVPRR
jgi:exopolysaccharide biosynthesis protein